MNVLKVYRSLNDEQKRALRDKKLDLNRPVDQLLTMLKPLAACDQMADAVRTKLGCTFALSIAAVIILTILAVNLRFPAGLVLALGVVVAVLIGAGYFYFWTRRIDVSNNFRQFMLPVLTVLREDIDASQPVHLHLDLTSPTAPSKKQSESAPYKEGVYYKVIDTMYRDDWMSAEALLVDGTKLSWSVSDTIRERKKTKRNPRGKIKTKTKYTKKTEIEVTMGLRKKTYELTAPAEGEVTTDGKRNRIRMERQVRTDSLEPLDPRALLDLVADVFRSTQPAAKEAGA